jgi:hypothetical protein
MNAREAREKLAKQNAFGHFSDIDGNGFAKGYLSAVKKAKPVLSSLEDNLREIGNALTQHEKEPWILFQDLKNFQVLGELVRTSAAVLAEYKKDCIGE